MSINGINLEDSEWMSEIESKFMDYQEHLWNLLEMEDDGEEGQGTLSGEPFCGCDTCQLRETLVFLIPHIIRGYNEGKVTLEE